MNSHKICSYSLALESLLLITWALHPRPDRVFWFFSCLQAGLLLFVLPRGPIFLSKGDPMEATRFYGAPIYLTVL